MSTENLGAPSGSDPGTAALPTAWKKVAKGIRAVLGETTVRTLMEKASSVEMYYI